MIKWINMKMRPMKKKKLYKVLRTRWRKYGKKWKSKTI